MAYRFTNTEKWNDAWFAGLRPVEKLLFMYLCDNCDIAGFIEINPKRWALDVGTDTKTIRGALEGLIRGLILSQTKDCFYIRNFLKHQKNLPLNPKNNSYVGIMRRFELYGYKFDIKDINEFIEGASKGLPSSTGNGNGNGNGKGEGVETKPKNKAKTKIFSIEQAVLFYKTQAERAKTFEEKFCAEYVKFTEFVCMKNGDDTRRLVHFLEMEHPLSLEEYRKLFLKVGGNSEKIKSSASSLETNIKYHNKYQDVYLTLNNWLTPKDWKEEHRIRMP